MPKEEMKPGEKFIVEMQEALVPDDWCNGYRYLDGEVVEAVRDLVRAAFLMGVAKGDL